MAKLLFAGTHGVEDPTQAGLVFLATKGGKEAVTMSPLRF